MRFEWNSRKAVANQRKHRVSFEDATGAFGDPLSRTISDPLHSEAEDRFVLVGMARSGRLLVVVHTHRADTIRIISARGATKHERKAYEDE